MNGFVKFDFPPLDIRHKESSVKAADDFFCKFFSREGEFFARPPAANLDLLAHSSPWFGAGAPFWPLAASPRSLLAIHRVAAMLEIKIMT
jgi:hypothetical protein